LRKAARLGLATKFRRRRSVRALLAFLDSEGGRDELRTIGGGDEV